MKKLLLILFMLIMPFQASWSAAAIYCQHEQNTSAQHFGHHVHKHEVVKGSIDDVQKPGKVHTDCGYCHSVSPAALYGAALTFAVPFDTVYTSPPSTTFSSYIADSPKWPDRIPVV